MRGVSSPSLMPPLPALERSRSRPRALRGPGGSRRRAARDVARCCSLRPSVRSRRSHGRGARSDQDAPASNLFDVNLTSSQFAARLPQRTPGQSRAATRAPRDARARCAAPRVRAKHKTFSHENVRHAHAFAHSHRGHSPRVPGSRMSPFPGRLRSRRQFPHAWGGQLAGPRGVTTPHLQHADERAIAHANTPHTRAPRRTRTRGGRVTSLLVCVPAQAQGALSASLSATHINDYAHRGPR